MLLLLFFFASKRNATYVWNSLLYPTEIFNPLPRVCTDGRGTLTSKPNFLASTGMASRNIVMKNQYTLLWSALLWTSFWHRYVVSFLLRMGLRCVRFADEDALLKRRKSGKYNKYLCKLENMAWTNRSFSVWSPIFKVIFKTFSTAFYALIGLGFSVTE